MPLDEATQSLAAGDGLVLKVGQYGTLAKQTRPYNIAVRENRADDTWHSPSDKANRNRALDVDHRPNKKIWTQTLDAMIAHIPIDTAAWQPEGLHLSEERIAQLATQAHKEARDMMLSNTGYIQQQSPSIILPAIIHRLTDDYSGKNTRKTRRILTYPSTTDVITSSHCLISDDLGNPDNRYQLKAAAKTLIRNDLTDLANRLNALTTAEKIDDLLLSRNPNRDANHRHKDRDTIMAFKTRFADAIAHHFAPQIKKLNHYRLSSVGSSST